MNEKKNRGGNVMYIVSTVLTVVFMVWMFSLSGWNPMKTLDFPSIIIVLGIVLIVLFGTGLIKDFNRAFGIAFYDKKDYRLTDIKKSLFAVKLSVVSAMINGLMATLFSLFMVGVEGTVPSEFISELSMAVYVLGSNISISILPMFYAGVFALLMLPVYGVLRRRSIEYMEEE